MLCLLLPPELDAPLEEALGSTFAFAWGRRPRREEGRKLLERLFLSNGLISAFMDLIRDILDGLRGEMSEDVVENSRMETGFFGSSIISSCSSASTDISVDNEQCNCDKKPGISMSDCSFREELFLFIPSTGVFEDLGVFEDTL